jgi:BCD family chlorophyll transporter-like MFS transporter
MNEDKLGWLSIVRLGLVQAALGAVVVLTTSTLNRVMVVELALPAMIPGALVTLHHAMQMLRPRMGHGSDAVRRKTPWILGGMAVLSAGGVGAAVATAMAATHQVPGLLLAVLSFALIGGGVSACGTSLLVLMAQRIAHERRAAGATIVWMMMIAGFAVTATLAGKMLDPFSPLRLVQVAGGVSGLALLVATVAIWGIEGKGVAAASAEPARPKTPFLPAFRQVWAEPDARRFTVFVFVSMLAYSTQDLILEPFAGAFFAFSPGESTKLSGTQHGGVFVGMLLVAVMTTVFKRRPLAQLKLWVVGGCMASAVAMLGLVAAGVYGPPWPLKQNVFVLGVANGVFSIAAIGSMMKLATEGNSGREGVRMGLWGAAQALAFGAGGFTGTALVELARWLHGPSAIAYSFVFALEALGFFAAQWLAQGTRFKEETVAAVPSGDVEPRFAERTAGGLAGPRAARPARQIEQVGGERGREEQENPAVIAAGEGHAGGEQEEGAGEQVAADVEERHPGAATASQGDQDGRFKGHDGEGKVDQPTAEEQLLQGLRSGWRSRAGGPCPGGRCAGGRRGARGRAPCSCRPPR